jgi:uncharacterized protein YbjT (DUF2867 family)
MENFSLRPESRALVVGATGFVGRRLGPELIKKNIIIRLFVRNPSKVPSSLQEQKGVEVMPGDLVKNKGLREALQGIHTAFYLVHSLGGKSIFRNKEFAEKDKAASRNFLSAADTEGLKRVIYLGGLGETGRGLSEHLQSRAEVAHILSSGNPSATILRAAIIIGAGGASFEMLRYLVERLPVMTCPQWINTKIHPVAIKDVIAYLMGCMLNSQTAGSTFDIGGPDILTYRTMMQQYAEARGLARRLIITLPFLTPLLSAYWVDLVTPIASGVAHPLIEGLKNEVICRDDRIDQLIPIQKTPYKEAVRMAVLEEKQGPGVSGF